MVNGLAFQVYLSPQSALKHLQRSPILTDIYTLVAERTTQCHLLTGGSNHSHTYTHTPMTMALEAIWSSVSCIKTLQHAEPGLLYSLVFVCFLRCAHMCHLVLLYLREGNTSYYINILFSKHLFQLTLSYCSEMCCSTNSPTK